MKKNYLSIISVVGFCFLAASGPVWAQAGSQGAIEAKEISKEEAAKKYPPPAGKTSYLPGTRAEGSEKEGFYRSPYSSKVFDCRKLKSGALILDTYARPPQVFARP